MPLRRAPKGSSKRQRQRVAASNIRELFHANRRKSKSKRRSRAQMIAIGLNAAGSRRR